MKNKEHSVVSVIKHKGWVGSHENPHDDIALIKLARKVKFNVNNQFNSILPACLPSPKIRSQLYNTKAFVAGNRCVHCLIGMQSVYVYQLDDFQRTFGILQETSWGPSGDFLETSSLKA